MATFADEDRAVAMLYAGSWHRRWNTVFALFDLNALDDNGRARLTHLIESPLQAWGLCTLGRVRVGTQVGLPNRDRGSKGSRSVFQSDPWSALIIRMPVMDPWNVDLCVGYMIPFASFEIFLTGRGREDGPVEVAWTDWSHTGVRITNLAPVQQGTMGKVKGSRSNFKDFHPARVLSSGKPPGANVACGAYCENTLPTLSLHTVANGVRAVDELEAREALGAHAAQVLAPVGYLDMSPPGLFGRGRGRELVLSDDIIIEFEVRLLFTWPGVSDRLPQAVKRFDLLRGEHEVFVSVGYRPLTAQ